MQTPSPVPQSARELPWLFGLCIVTWFIGALTAAYGVWQLLPGFDWDGLSTLILATAVIIAGVGLYRVRSWGVTLFGLAIMRIQVELVDFIRESIPAFAKNGPNALAGNILFLVLSLVLVLLTAGLMMIIFRYTQPGEPWRPRKVTTWPGSKQ